MESTGFADGDIDDITALLGWAEHCDATRPPCRNSRPMSKITERNLSVGRFTRFTLDAIILLKFDAIST